MSIDRIPHHHRDVNGYLKGNTESGFPFEIEVSTQNYSFNTLGRARMMMHLQEKIMEKKGVTAYQGFRQAADIKWQSVEEKTSITLRLAAPGKTYRVPIIVNGDGSYTAMNESAKSLREVVRDVSRSVEYVHGKGISAAAMRM